MVDDFVILSSLPSQQGNTHVASFLILSVLNFVLFLPIEV